MIFRFILLNYIILFKSQSYPFDHKINVLKTPTIIIIGMNPLNSKGPQQCDNKFFNKECQYPVGLARRDIRRTVTLRREQNGFVQVSSPKIVFLNK